MEKENMKKTSVLLVTIAFVLGLILGYGINEITKSEYQFATGENILQNSDFESEIENLPVYWFKAHIPADNLTMELDNSVSYSGSRSVSISNTNIYDEEVSNNWAQTIDNVPIDKTVELTGWLRTVDAESVVMVIQCWDENDEMVGFGTTQTEGNITGSSDWTQYTASVNIPSETEKIIVRLALTGTGQVWFDDVTLVIK
jgi:hypothetical protein